jgi:hypothetical protein
MMNDESPTVSSFIIHRSSFIIKKDDFSKKR